MKAMNEQAPDIDGMFQELEASGYSFVYGDDGFAVVYAPSDGWSMMAIGKQGAWVEQNEHMIPTAYRHLQQQRELREYRRLLFDMHEQQVELSVLHRQGDYEVLSEIADRFNTLIQKYNIKGDNDE